MLKVRTCRKFRHHHSQQLLSLCNKLQHYYSIKLEKNLLFFLGLMATLRVAVDDDDGTAESEESESLVVGMKKNFLMSKSDVSPLRPRLLLLLLLPLESLAPSVLIKLDSNPSGLTGAAVVVVKKNASGLGLGRIKLLISDVVVGWKIDRADTIKIFFNGVCV